MDKVIEFLGNKNTNYSSRRDIKPACIVNHISQGSAKSCINWFTSSKNNISSAHFLVTKLGKIYQFVKIEDTAWGNGLYLEDIKFSKSSLAKSKNINPNLYSVSIEHEGIYEETKGALTNSQLRASIWLHRYIITYIKEKYNYKIPKNQKHIIGHCHIDPRRKPFCPGEKFPYNKIIEGIINKVHFTDIENHWAKKDIEILNKKGWILGYPNGEFKPEESVKRGELAALINRIIKKYI